MTGKTFRSTSGNNIRKQLLLLILLVFLVSLNCFSIHGEDNDLSPQQWYYFENNGVYFPDWNKYTEDGQPKRNISQVNGEDVVVAVLDTGIDYNHEDLKDVMWTGGGIDALKSFGGSIYGYDAVGEMVDGVTRHDDPMDREGHGTHVAGIIGAKWNHIGVSGALNGVKLMAVRTSQNGNIDYVKAGMEYVLAAKKTGVNVAAINLSWNGGIGNSTPEILYNTIKELTENGVTICISAGNESSDLNEGAYVSSFFRSIPGVIIVGASDRNRELTDFSNHGTHFLDVVTPGYDILSTYFDPEQADESGNPRHDLYKNWEGTSMAAPIATAASALLYSVNPELSAGQRAARIIETSVSDEKLKAKGGFLSIEGFLDDHNSSPYLYSGDYNGEVLNLHGFDLGNEGTLVIDGVSYSTLQWSNTLITVNLNGLEAGEHYITVTSGNTSRSYWICVTASTSEAGKLDSELLQDKVITSMTVDEKKMFIATDDKYFPQNKTLLEYDFQSGNWNRYTHESLGAFNTTVSNNGTLYYFDSYDYGLYQADLQSGNDTRLAQLSVSQGYTTDYSLFCVDDEIYLAYKYENWPDTQFCISRYTDGSFIKVVSIAEDLIKICDLYRNGEEFIILTSRYSDDYLKKIINAYRIEEGSAVKLSFEVIIEDYSIAPSARGYGNTIIISPVEHFWTSDLDNSLCFSYSVDQYDLSDSSLIKSTTIGGGHLSFLSKTKSQVSGNTFYFVGSADSMPHNSFIYQIDPVTLYEVKLSQTEGGTIESDHSKAYSGQTVTLSAEADDHHAFDKWIVTDFQGKPVEVKDNRFVMPEGDVTVSALFSIRKCTVSFDSNGGSGDMKPVQADIDTLFTLPVCTFNPPGEDTLFDCWVVIFKGKDAVEKKAGDSIVLSDDVVLKAKWKDFEYEYIGDIRRWILNNEGSLDFIFKRTVNDYKTYGNFLKSGIVEIDGNKIHSYGSRQGSLIITLDSSYLNTLSAGTHTMKVFFTDGSCSTVFVVEKKQDSYSVPITGIH